MFQKSLLRKYWKDQKYSDKYLQITFKKRIKEKMKTRKNRTQHEDCVKKLLNIKTNTEKYLKDIMFNLARKEYIKRLKIKIQQLEFEFKISNSKSEKNKIENKIKELIKMYEVNDKPAKLLQVKESLSTINNVNYKGSIINNNSNNNNKSILNNKNKNNNAHKEINDNTTSLNCDLTTINDNNAMKAYNKKNNKSNNTNNNGILTNSNIIHNNNIGSSFNNLQLEKEIIKRQYEKRIREENELMNYLRYRIRMNKLGNVVIDRYVKSDTSMNPFNEEIDYLIYNELKEDEYLAISPQDNSKYIICLKF